jgi:hypothetical protein
MARKNVQIIHRCCFLCCALLGYDETLVILLPFVSSKESRRVWKVLFQHVTHALSGFSRLSHKNVLSSTIEKKGKSEEKSFSGKFRLTLFRFRLLLLFIRRLTSRKGPQSNCFVPFRLLFACALSELYEKFRLYFSLFTSAHNTSIKTASRFGEKLTS